MSAHCRLFSSRGSITDQNPLSPFIVVGEDLCLPLMKHERGSRYLGENLYFASAKVKMKVEQLRLLSTSVCLESAEGFQDSLII